MRPIMAKAISYMKPDIDPNTRLCVPFNEGTGSIAKDYSQYGNHAQLTDVEWSNDGYNGAGKFNGSSSFGNCGNDASLNVIDALSIEVRVKPNLVHNGVVIWKRHGTVDQSVFYIRTIDDNYLYFGVYTDLLHYHKSLGTYTSENSICVTLVYDKISIRSYLDGMYDTKTDETNDIVTSVYGLLFGKYTNIATPRFFNGTIDNVILSSTAKSAAQAAADCYEVVCS